MKEVTLEVLANIIEERKPLGLFYSQEGSRFVAVDNSQGEAWTEDFETIEQVRNFLLGQED